MTPEPRTSLRSAARRVQVRLTLQGWFGVMRRTAVPVFVCAFAALVLYRISGLWSCGIAAGIGAVALWLAGTGLWAFLRRASPVEAMAVWDRRAETGEMFVSGYCFERRRSGGQRRAEGDRSADGEALHLSRTYEKLEEEIEHLPRHFSLRPSVAALILPALLVAFSATGLLAPAVSPDDLPVEEPARRRAEEVSRDLEEEAEQLEENEALEDEEKREIERLKKALAETARDLEDVSEDTPREVLKKLERRAREAEELARSLGAEGATDLSSALLSELGRHADTADLASALRAKDLAEIAKQAEQLAQKLRREKLPVRQRQRMKRALKQSMQKATGADKRTLSGRHLAGAASQMSRGNRRGAASQLSRMSRGFRRLQQRRSARQRVQRLARRLRGAGQRIFGRNPGGMRRLANRSGSRPGSAGSAGNILRRLSPQMPSGSPSGGGSRSPTWRPGPRSGRPNRPGSGSAPVPGTAGPGGGNRAGGQGPVPGPGGGQQPGSGPPGASPGGAPVPGMGAGQGGLEAGTGSAPYAKKKTQPHGARRTGVVGPAPGGAGPSAVRARAGSPHGEEAARETRRIVLEKIRSQEAAIAEEPIPLTRREQVLRYFSALRKELENDE